MGDDWWRKAGKTELLLRSARKGDARALKKADRLIKDLRRDHGIEQITTAYQSALLLMQYIERPRYMPVFRRSYAFDVFCDGLVMGKTRGLAIA